MGTAKNRQARYAPAAEPPPMRFQAAGRDGAILQAIDAHDGVLARRQIQQLFWPDATQRAMEMRLSKLYHSRYLDWPSLAQRRTCPIVEPVVWLGWRGALWVATQRGITVSEPKREGENQLRALANRLRAGGMRWVREPRWSQLEHDLGITDFRLQLQQALAATTAFKLKCWLSEGELHADPDTISVTIAERNGQTREERRQIIPDGYAAIDHVGHSRNRFLLEYDNATHPGTRFGQEKMLPGAAYIDSEAYERRFGYRAGRWLITTTSPTRMRNLMTQTQQAIAGHYRSDLFLFTTHDQWQEHNLLRDPIWLHIGSDEPVTLFASTLNASP